MRPVAGKNPSLLAPSILAGDHGDLRKSTREVENLGLRWLHLDIMDGHFVPNLTFGPATVAALRKDSQLFFDVHLMLANPDAFVEPFAEAGADLISFHIEAPVNHRKVLRQIEERGCQKGLVINPGTAPESIYSYLDSIDLLLVMTVQPGFGGQSFKEDMIRKIRKIHQWRVDDNHLFRLEVDGGIDLETAKLCTKAGADTFVAGTAFFKSPEKEKFIDTIESLS
ncbi:MAG: ribulose-phosphate 3-epimerase [Opitutales bacterium]|nr:ribulose-phosphate 3-epimerase [Opitutales bacterium]